MTITHIVCALLAPVLATAAAFPWALPEPTTFMAAFDAWSPAPTEAPRLNLFRRDESEDGNTCGFVSGLSESSITCPNTAICATNTYLGVHGCCDPSSLSSCTIPTTCIPGTALSTVCTDAACTSDAAIVKCTEAGLGECYEWLFVYPKTTMTQHGCAESQFTSTAQRSWGVSSSSVDAGQRTVTVTAPPATTPTSTVIADSSSEPRIGTIIGGTIGGCIFLSVIAFGFFVWYRRRRTQRDALLHPAKPGTQFSNFHSQMEYNPLGFSARYVESDHKVWQQQQHAGAVHRESDAVEMYPGISGCGVVEVEGVQRPVEAPT